MNTECVLHGRDILLRGCWDIVHLYFYHFVPCLVRFWRYICRVVIFNVEIKNHFATGVSTKRTPSDISPCIEVVLKERYILPSFKRPKWRIRLNKSILPQMSSALSILAKTPLVQALIDLRARGMMEIKKVAMISLYMRCCGYIVVL